MSTAGGEDALAPLGIPRVDDDGTVTPIIPPTGWTAPELLDPWFNSAERGGFAATNELAGYYLDVLGVVHIRGLITTDDESVGMDGDPVQVFTLPPGYRPPGAVIQCSAQFIGLDDEAHPGHIQVLTDGRVFVQLHDYPNESAPGAFGAGNTVSLRISFETW